MAATSGRTVYAWLLGLLLIVCYVLLANDGRHHWHEFRYLYSATFYSTAELLNGVFDPGPAPVRTAAEVAAWNVTEVFHLYVLKQLVKLFGLGLTSYTIIKILYGTLLVLAVAVMAVGLRNLGLAARSVALISGLVLLSPVTVYLGFKLLGEIPSWLFLTIALALFTAGLRWPSRQMILGILAGIALTLSVLASARMPLAFVGFWGALCLVWVAKQERKSLTRASLATWVAFLVTWPVGLWLLGGSLMIYVDAVRGFIAFTKPLPMWAFAIFNVGLFGMGFWLLLPMAVLSREARLRRFFLVWLLLSTLPAVVMAVNFLEPRYLLVGIIPFAGLAALGLEGLWEHMLGWRWKPLLRGALVGVLGILVVGGSAAAQYFMPYETDEKQLLQAVQSERASETPEVLLLPWNYTDFHFLRFLFPDKPIYLVQSATNASGALIQDPVWTERFAAMYGEHFLASATALLPFTTHRMVYIGWTILPSLQNLHDVFRRVGFSHLSARLESSPFLNHMTQSWLWRHAQFPMQERARYGQYRVYRVEYKPFPSPAANKQARKPF